MELIGRSMQSVGSGFDHRVHYRARAAAELCAVRIGLDLELLERVDRGLHDLRVAPAERVGVGSIIDAIQQKPILERAIAVHIESALETDRLQPWRGGQNAGRQLRQQIVVASVKGQFNDFAFIDDGAAA